MSNRVSYQKEQRERAIRERKGLVTIQVIYPGKKPGKLGGSITFQGPSDEAEIERVMALLNSIWTDRAPNQELPR